MTTTLERRRILLPDAHQELHERQRKQTAERILVPYTITAPVDLQRELRAEAERIGTYHQDYLSWALERYVDKYERHPAAIPEPLPRPQPTDPNYTTRVPPATRDRLRAVKDALNDAKRRGERNEHTTLAALTLHAYRQMLAFTRDTF